MENKMFQKAHPIWIKDKSREKNVFAVFRMNTALKRNAELHITGCTFYRVFVNGVFQAFGPARTAEGYARKDVLSIKAQESGSCEIMIEAVGYYCCALSTVFQPSFLLAELVSDGKVLAYTGRDFEAFQPPCKLQKTERYSMQRHFSEVWDYRDCTSVTDEKYRAEAEILPLDIRILDRTAPYPLYQDAAVNIAATRGIFEYDETLPFKEKRYSNPISERWGTFEMDEIPYHPYTWIQRQKQTITDRKQNLPLVLKEGEYAVLDFDRIEAGFFKLHMKALEESDVVISFTEYYEGEDFCLQNMNCHNVLEYLLPAQDHREHLSFEPYTCRFAILAVKKGCIRLDSFGIKTFMFDISHVVYPDYQDETINSIYRAAVRTFAHNAVDLYSDCPSRERAGWLCDSWFTAKTEYALTGQTGVEDAFLENFRLYENKGEYPEGVLPMCYPSDQEDSKKFIPQWTMWYILEAAEYMLERGHQDKKEEFRDSIYGLLHFYQKYENEDGLLERLPSWNFVEWSKANSWTMDVNYPTNFLYAQVLDSIADVYGDEACRHRAKEVRKAAASQSFNGQVFLDHAVRNENGKLILQEDCSEAGQYYAVLFGGIDLDSAQYKPLKHLILHVFSPDRAEDVMPEVMEVNAFIGVYLRIAALMKIKEYKLLLKDIVSFFGKMDAYTGTLWEYRQFKGSYDHGFASYALVAIREAMKGVEIFR